MSNTVTKEENYSLLTLTQDALLPANTEGFTAECTKLIKENSFLIVNCKAITEIDAEQRDVLVAVTEMAVNAKGSLIIAELPEELTEILEEEGLNCLPTNEEAIDFIFMEQIETQFLGEEEEGEL